MSYRYRFTGHACADLDDIVEYIAVKLCNRTAAGDFLDHLQREISRICMFPESGASVVNEFLPDLGVRKCFIDNYTMYYVSDPDTESVTILRIIYSRRNAEELLKELGL